MKTPLHPLSVVIGMLFAGLLGFAFSAPNDPCEPYILAKNAIADLMILTDEQDENFDQLVCIYGGLHQMNADCETDNDDLVLDYYESLEGCDADPTLCRVEYIASYEGGEHQEAILMFTKALRQGLMDTDYLNDMIGIRRVGMGAMPLQKFRPKTQLFKELAVVQKMKASPLNKPANQVLSRRELNLLQDLHLQPVMPAQDLRKGH